MLQKLNERIQGLVAWIIISLIAVTFALFGIDYYIQSRQTSMTAVEVNGNSISKQDVELQYRRMRQAQDPAKMTAASDAQLKQQVLEQLIVNEISVEAARKQGFQVTPAQANAAILSIPQFQEDGQFSPSRYQQAISGALFTSESFNKQVQQGMLLNQQRFAIIGTSFTLPSEVDRFVKLYFQTRDYGYMTLPASQFINEQQVTNEEIKSYYDQHQNDFISPEQISLEYVELSVKDISNEVQVSDEQARQYYEANQANFLTPAKWTVNHILLAFNGKSTDAELKTLQEKAQQIYQKVQSKPGQFAEFAKQYSDDAISAAKGGALPTITAGQSDFDKYLVKLKKPGQISEPMKTEHGYEIFQLTAYQKAQVKPFEQVKTQIVEQLKADTVQNLYAKRLEELTDLSYQTPDSLQLAASETGLKIKTTGLFTKNGGQSSITKHPEVIRQAFSHDVLDLENNSSPIQLNNNTMVVVRVKEHIQSKQKPLAEVSEEIKTIVARFNAAQKAKEVGKELVAAAKDKKQFLKLKEKYQLKWKKVNNISRDADSVPAEINELAFSIANPNTVTGKLLSSNEFAIVKLDRVIDGAMSQLDEERKDSIEEQLESNYGIMDYDLYVSGLLKKADIKRQSS